MSVIHHSFPRYLLGAVAKRQMLYFDRRAATIKTKYEEHEGLEDY